MFSTNTPTSASSLSDRSYISETLATLEIHPDMILAKTDGIKPLLHSVEILAPGENEYRHIEHRTCFQRTFGKMNPGSLRGSIFALMSTALGVALLGLPYAVGESGVIIVVLFIITGGMITIWSMYSLAETGIKRGIFDYPRLIADVMGKTSGQIFQLMLIFYIFGAITNFFLTGSMFLKDTLGRFGLNAADFFQIGWAKNLEILLIGFFVFPIACIRKLHGLRHTNILGVFGISFVVLLVILQTPSFMQQNYVSENTNYFTINYNIFHTFAITTFAFAGHTNVFPIISELSRPSERRIKKVFNRAILAETFMFISVSICGYLSLQGQTPELITLRPALTPTDPDILMNIARVLMTINYCIFAIPIRVNPLRTQVFMMMKLDPDSVGTIMNCLCTGFILLFAGLLAMLFPNVQAFFSIFGGTLTVLVTIYYPGMLVIKSSSRSSFKTKLSRIITVYGVFMGFTSALLTILDDKGVDYEQYLNLDSIKNFFNDIIG